MHDLVYSLLRIFWQIISYMLLELSDDYIFIQFFML